MKFSGFLAGKIKTLPEDFIVKEKISLEVTPITPSKKLDDTYYLYELKKINWNTMDILIRIAKENNIPLREIQYGGKKDRYAITYQYITSKKMLTLPEAYKDKVELKILGVTNTPMSTRSIIENEFTITIRSVQEKELDKFYQNVEFIKNSGFINYYDDQRFSSFKNDRGIPSFFLLTKDYEGFIKNYLTNTITTESKEAKDRKYEIEKNWGNWQKCFSISKTNLEKNIFKYIIEHPEKKNLFEECLNFLPTEEVRFMLSILQGYIWNHCVTNLITQNIQEENVLYFKTRVGNFAFLLKDEKLPFNEFPLIHHKIYEQKVYHPYFNQVLDYIRNNYLKNQDPIDLNINIKNQKLAIGFRKIKLIPKNFQILEVKNDDKYENRKMIRMQFSLHSGAYATMLLKRLLLRI
jgi:tRNA pseudouridine13 synthase